MADDGIAHFGGNHLKVGNVHRFGLAFGTLLAHQEAHDAAEPERGSQTVQEERVRQPHLDTLPTWVSLPLPFESVHRSSEVDCSCVPARLRNLDY